MCFFCFGFGASEVWEGRGLSFGFGVPARGVPEGSQEVCKWLKDPIIYGYKPQYPINLKTPKPLNP